MKVKFSPKASTKIKALVDGFSTEVEWHGLVSRTEQGFEVEDVIVFPHKATSGHVESDQEEYEKWLDSLSDEEFNKLRFHGHSHVNMPVTPSGFDNCYRQNMVNNMPKESGDDVFYIFAIFNKKGDISCQVFDIANDKVYVTSEISIEYEPADEDVEAFVEHARSIVTIAQPTYISLPTPETTEEDEWDKLIKRALLNILYGADEDAEDAYMYLRDLGGMIEECGGYYEPDQKL